jgi:hypothetical protein
MVQQLVAVVLEEPPPLQEYLLALEVYYGGWAAIELLGCAQLLPSVG